jgi:hypothetical protein
MEKRSSDVVCDIAPPLAFSSRGVGVYLCLVCSTMPVGSLQSRLGFGAIAQFPKLVQMEYHESIAWLQNAEPQMKPFICVT